MIHAVLICWVLRLLVKGLLNPTSLDFSLVNTSGVPRFTKFYTPLHQSAQSVVQKTFSLVSARPPGLCNFLDAPELEDFLGFKGDSDERWRVVYRTYATLYFVFVVDGAESELGILDLIQVMSLNEYSVSENQLSCLLLDMWPWYTGLCGISRSSFRKCMRIRPRFSLWRGK